MLPQLEDIPSEIDLSTVKEFIRQFDPTASYRQRWGANYLDNMQTLWNSQIERFQSSLPADVACEDLLMVMTFDYYLGPSLGVPSDRKVDFFAWLCAGMKRGLAQG